MYSPGLGRFWSVDPEVRIYVEISPYAYTLNNPIQYLDYLGLFPIKPRFRAKYPLITAFIENQLREYILNSPRMLRVLREYSAGALTIEQIEKDFASEEGPIIASKSYEEYDGTMKVRGEYDYYSNTIYFSEKELSRFEKILSNPKEEVRQWGKMDFTKLFIHEYVHYGDALDGLDAIRDEEGKIVNDPNTPEPSFGENLFEEGYEAAEELFPLPTGRQNYYYYKYGQIIDIKTQTIISTDRKVIDHTMVPPK